MAKNSLTVIKKPDAKIWKARIEIAQKIKEKKFDERAKRFREMFKGDHFPKAPEGDYIVINYCYAILKAILPQIYFQDPYLYLEAGDGETQDENVMAAEAVLNEFWYEIRVKKQIKKAILDALIYGLGLVKIGYKTDTVKGIESGGDNSEMIKNEYPFYRRISPLHVVFDTDVSSVDDISWIAANYYLPEPLVKDRYKNTDSINAEYYSTDSIFVEQKKYGQDIKNDIKRVSIWEIQDLNTNYIYTITKGSDDFLKEIPNPYKLDGLNYKFLYLNEVPDEIYPLSDLEQIKDIVLELDKTETQLLNHRAKGQRKIVSEVGIWATPEDKDAFFNNEDMQNSEVMAGQLDKIRVFDCSTIDASLYNIQSELKDNLYKISATGENQLAAESTTQKTATEAAIIDSNSKIRSSERVDCVRDFITDTGHVLLKVLQQFMSKKVPVKYKDLWYEFTKENLKGKFKIKVRVEDLMQPNQEKEQNKISKVVAETISSADENNLPLVNRKELLTIYFDKYGFNKEEIDRLLSPPAPLQTEPEPQPAIQENPMDLSNIPPEILAQLLAQVIPPNTGGNVSLAPASGMGGVTPAPPIAPMGEGLI